MAIYRKGKVDGLTKQRQQHMVELKEKLAAREMRVKESYAAHAVEVRSGAESGGERKESGGEQRRAGESGGEWRELFRKLFRTLFSVAK